MYNTKSDIYLQVFYTVNGVCWYGHYLLPTRNERQWKFSSFCWNMIQLTKVLCQLMFFFFLLQESFWNRWWMQWTYYTILYRVTINLPYCKSSIIISHVYDPSFVFFFFFCTFSIHFKSFSSFKNHL